MTPYELALQVQDAVNLSGIVKDWARQLDAVWAEAREKGLGTEYVNTHPTTVLIIDKLAQLAGMGLPGRTVEEAYDAVRQRSEPEPYLGHRDRSEHE